MQRYQIGETVEVLWLGLRGAERVQGTIIDIPSKEFIVVRVKRPNEPAVECSFEPWRVKKLNEFSVMGDTNAKL